MMSGYSDTLNIPVGFDGDIYLSLNQDVEEAGVEDAQKHYLEYGRFELRAILWPGEGLDHPESRLLSSTERLAWEASARALASKSSLQDVIQNHPRASWLYTGFTLAGYLQKNQDVAAFIDQPLMAAFHFLEIGLEEGRLGLPEAWDASFVSEHYGLEFDPKATRISTVLGALLKQGENPLEIVLTETQHWECFGFSGAVLADMFDHEYYHAIASQANVRPESFKRANSITHLMQTGLQKCLPIAPNFGFDPEFYRTYPDIKACIEGGQRNDTLLDEPTALYAHWLKKGLRQGLQPNLQAWALHKFGIKPPEELLSQFKVFKKAASLAENVTDMEVFEALVKTPRPAIAPLDLSKDVTVECVVDLADKLAISGDQDQAEWLYWHVLSVLPSHGRARRHLADLVQQKGNMEQALTLRKRLHPDADTGWNCLTLAEALLITQRLEEAGEALARLPAKALADVSVLTKHRELTHRLFDTIWNDIEAHVDAYGIERTQRQLRLALQACTPDFVTAQRGREVKHVALIGNEDLYQCKLYRVDQKADQLRHAGYEVTVISPTHGLAGFHQMMNRYDAVIFFRVPAFPPMIDAMSAAAQHGLLTFYEIDDVVFDAAHFPPSLESYADQIDAAHYALMSCGVPLFEHAMSLCDYGMASTATIAKLMEGRVRTGRVFEHHNALGKLHMTAIRENADVKREDNAPLVIFYGSGTKAHKEDFHDILEPALAEIVRRHPGKIEIRLIGHFGSFKHLDPETASLTFIEPIWDFEEFCARVAQVDINLSVLSSTLLTDAKSEIKWMEAAMFGIPSVVSATATHRETIEDGVTGFLCETAEDFTQALERLVTDPALRTRIGSAAKNIVMERYALEPMGQSLRDMFTELRPAVQPPKPRLMVVNVFYPPQAIGGATRVVHDNISDLIAKYGDRYEIDVVCTLEGGSVPFEVKTYAHDGVRVHAITAPPLEGGDMAPSSPKMGQVFEDLVIKYRPDLVHFHCIQRLTASAVDVLRHRAIPYVITLHDGWWISDNQFIIDDTDAPKIYDYANRFGDDFPDRARALVRPLMGAQHLMAVSDSFAELHRAAGLNNVITVENGVSPLSPVIGAPDQKASGAVRLAHIGGAARHKGFHLVRNALLANEYKNLELLLIDHAMPMGSVKYETWGTTPVTIVGKVPQSEVAALYARIDMLLAPSIWPESYGLVTREAITCGVWVIASDRGAIGADVVEGENGYRIDVGTYAGLAECLARIDADPERHRQPPQKSAALRSSMDQVDDLVKVYDRILENTKTPE